ncbi:MAG: DUF58 domain-containing protein [Paludibacteraceae bacterium]|nr:DUF58 domain-containing protein [Paludibacteraceae bacterium]
MKKKSFSFPYPYPRKRFVATALVGLATAYLSSYWNSLSNVSTVVFVVLFVLSLVDVFFLYMLRGTIECERIVSDVLSNGDDNDVVLRLKNTFAFDVDVVIEDGIPDEFQMRDFELNTKLAKGEEKELVYKLRPVRRGEYLFYDISVFVARPWGFLRRKVVIPAEKLCKVLPSYMFLHNMEFLSIMNQDQKLGAHKIPKLGNGSEFENIREYTQGDDYRMMNWKATARRHTLMVNQYSDQRCQDIYSIIDKGRGMQHTFNGLTLLDYSINSSLQLSYVALRHQDNAGLLTFENEIGSHLPSSHNMIVLHKMQETLYNEKTSFAQSDYMKLLSYTRSTITKRSLMVIYTSFDSLNSLKRQLSYIQMMAKSHVVLVVFFIDQDIYDMAAQPTKSTLDNATQMVAQNFMFEQKQIVKELRKRGIFSLLTHPMDLNANVINKYLELKARHVV